MKCAVASLSILLSCCSSTTIAQSDPILLSAATPEQVITSAGYLADPEGTITIDSLLTSEAAIRFQTYDHGKPGYTDSVKNYWLRFTVHNLDSVDREWVFNFDGWSYVTAYFSEPGGGIAHRMTGHLLPFTKRDYPVANRNNLLFHLEGGKKQVYHVLLQERPDHVIKPTGLHFKASLRSILDSKNSRNRQIISIFMGIYAVMFLYNLFIYISIRDKAYIFYLLHILGLSYMTLNNSGHAVAIVGSVFENFPLWRGTIESFVSAFNTIVLILFTITFLETRKHLPFWHKVLLGLIGMILITLIGANISINVFKPVAALVMISILVTLVIVGVRSIRKKVPSAPYYLIAYIFSIAGTAVLALAFLGVLPLNDFTLSYSMPTGYTLQILFFSFALANRINILKRSNEENQKRIIEHLRENEQLQLRATNELEEKVARRTREVVLQKEVIQAEKEKSEKLLYNILPQPIAKELMETGSTKPARYDEVSILFTDFVDFTNISASIPPARLVQELNAIFYLFDDIVMESGLEKIKTIGDSYMAVSGLPIERADHAVACVRAAIAMQKCIDEHNRVSSIKWHIRAGIHSGPVIAGVVGKQKFTFDLWGDTVNLASRMETAGEPGKVNMSAYTYDLVRNEIRCKYRGKISVKGKGDIDMYFVDEE